MKKMSESELKKRLGVYVAPDGLYAKTKDMPFLGKVSCNVERIAAGSWQEIVIDYELGASGMADGSWFKATFRFYSDWALFQTTDPKGANYISAEYHAAPTLPGQSPATVQSLKVRFDQKGHERPFQKAVIVDTFDGYIKAGDHIVIRLGDRRFGGPGTRVQTFVEENFRFRCYVDPLGTSRFAAVNPDLVIQIVPGVPAQIQWVGSRIVRVGEKCPLRVRAEDEWGNSCWNQPEKIAVSAMLNGKVVYEKNATLAAKGWAVLLIDDLPTKEPGELVITAHLPEHPWVRPQTFYLAVERGLDVARIYYCDLHVHSDDTIGTNSTNYNLTYGRDVSGLDILAFAHNDFNITTERWNKTVDLIREINKEGEFIAFPGTEWCGSSCAGGDHNVVFLHGETPEFPFLKTGEHVRSVEWNEEMGSVSVEPGAWPLEELWAAYAKDPEGHLLIPHVGGRRCILDWHYPKLERLIEIGSSWGHFGWLYQEAMERGYRIGASMAGDEHRGRCGGGVPGTAVFGTKGGISGVIAHALTRKDIAQGLRARHTFASTGERTFGITRCAGHIMGDEFNHNGRATIEYRFLGDAGWDEIAAYDHSGQFWHRNLQEEAGYSARKVRFRWGGARVKDRYRWAAWKGKITITNAVINDFVARGFEHIEETCWRESTTQIGFKSDTYGDVDAIEMDISHLAGAEIRVEGTIDGYVKVGDPLKGNPFVHCPTFEWEITGKELLESGNLRNDLPGIEMFLALERMSDQPVPRDVAGTLDLDPVNGPHGFRPVYLLARQIDDAKIWTSAMFITFQ
ncbi:MAG: CehA/McbA family metallohydrolase domain-containing protein [Acidiferrobacterales bacterium]